MNQAHHTERGYIMKATHTKEFFEKYEAELFMKYKKQCDFENDLAMLMPDFDMIPEEYREKAKSVVIKMEAEKVAKVATEELVKKMHMIEEIKSGHASLGFTTMVQEVSHMHDLVEGFEFSCYMLAQFKKKYKIA